MLKFHSRITLMLTMIIVSSLATGCRKAPPKGPAFRIVPLLGKKIDAVQNTLLMERVSTPPRLQQALKEGEQARTFKKDEWLLTVTYIAATGKVLNFTIGTEKSEGRLKEKELFLQAGTVREDDPLYAIDYVESPDTVFAFDGVRVTPLPISHEVILRLTGTNDLMEITYSLGGPHEASISGEHLSLPPWEKKFTVLTGTKINFNAYPSPKVERRTWGGPREANTQILVDGKVVDENKLGESVTGCEYEIEY